MRIGILGPWGVGNLGDGSVATAIICNIRKHSPDAEICAFSLNPEETGRMHGIASFPSARPRRRPSTPLTEKPPSAVNRTRPGLRAAIKAFPPLYQLLRLLRRSLNALAAAGAEIPFAIRCYRHLRTFDLFIVSGGGQLSDYWGGPWSHPFTLFKWAILAKAARTGYVFMSVGAGPLNSGLSKFFIRRSLLAADYKSFRDERSRKLIESIGSVGKSSVFPDLAYSLLINGENLERKSSAGNEITVGISPISYLKPGVWAKEDESTYRNYIRRLAEMSLWLVNNGYKVLFFQSQAMMDTLAIEDLKTILSDMGHPDLDDQITEPQVSTVKDLLSAISRTDMVIASRFHSVLLSSLLHKPIIAISFDVKVRSLMENLQLSEYILDIHNFDLSSLALRFRNLEEKRDAVSAQLMASVSDYRAALESQYSQVFDGHLVHDRNR